MRILISDSSTRHIGQSLASAFIALGHEANLIFDDKSYYLLGHKALTFSPFRKTARAFLRSHKRQATDTLLASAKFFSPDVVVVIQGDHFENSGISALKKVAKIAVFNWIVHDPVLSEFYDPIRIANLAGYSRLFIADKLWEPCVYFFEKPLTYLPLAGDDTVFKPLSLKKDIDVLFVGDLFPPSPYATSGIVHSRVLERLLQRGFNLKALVRHRGSISLFIPRLSKLPVISGRQAPEFINVLYNRAKVVLNLFGLDYKNDAPESFFNTSLASALQVVERKNSLSDFFGDSAIQFQSLKELETHLDQCFGGNSHIFSDKTKNLRDAVLAKHLYKHRAEKILEAI